MKASGGTRGRDRKVGNPVAGMSVVRAEVVAGGGRAAAYRQVVLLPQSTTAGEIALHGAQRGLRRDLGSSEGRISVLRENLHHPADRV